MSELRETTDKLFRLYQHCEPVTIGEGAEAVTVNMWKPTDEEARMGQMFMLQRVGFWENEDDKVAERVEQFLANLPEDKAIIISQILEQTIAQKFSENVDLLDPIAIKGLEKDMLVSLELADINTLWEIRPGSEAQLEATLRTKAGNILRADVAQFLVKADEVDVWMNAEVIRKAEEVFREQETEIYMEESFETLKKALGTVNKRTVAMGLAVQDWTRHMCALMTREVAEDNVKGALIFSDNKKNDNYIGHVAPEVLGALTDKMNELFNTSRARAIREVAADVNFPKPAESASDSISPRPVVVVPQTSEGTPTI